MKRTQIYFMIGVWGALGMGFLITHYKTPEPEIRVFATGNIEVDMPPLNLPRGETELSGFVRLPDGTPVEECQVFLYSGELESETAAPLHWTFTDRDGAFSFADLENGAFEVSLTTPLTPPTMVSIQLPVEDPVVWTLNPETPPLPVLPELERASIAGRLHLPGELDPIHHPLEGYEVRLVPAKDMPMLSGAVERREKTDPLGNFHVPLVAHGEYRLEVLPPWARGGTWPILAHSTLFAGQDQNRASALEIPLEMGALRGVVTNLDDIPIEGALVKVFPLADDGGPGPAGRFWPPTGTDANGVFLVIDLPPGLYRLRVKAGLSAYETKARIRAGEITEVVADPLNTRRGG